MDIPPRILGRPTLPPSKRKVTVGVTLDRKDIEHAKELGDGNISLGIRIALFRESMRHGMRRRYYADKEFIDEARRDTETEALRKGEPEL